MGWTEGEGLGKDGTGRKIALKPPKKVDKLGIGAEKSYMNWVYTSIAYDDVLAKLNIVYADDKKRKRDSDDEDDENNDDDDDEGQEKKADQKGGEEEEKENGEKGKKEGEKKSKKGREEKG